MQAPPLSNPTHPTPLPSEGGAGGGSSPAAAHPPQTSPIRCLTIDVEEHFHVEAAHGIVPRTAWPTLPRRAERNVDRLLELFDRTGSRATLFFLGDVARAHPALARRCADAGHEIASHGNRHDRLHRLDPRSFREDLRASKGLLEDQIGRAVRGYRAPTWSITRDTAWAVDVLIEAGFTYDASIFPVHHPWYGVPDAPSRPFYVRSSPHSGEGVLLELPPLTWRALGRNLPVAGGGYFRLLPGASAMMRRGLAQAAKQGRPAILYFHPWEFDPGAARLPLPPIARRRTYAGLRTAERRLERILRATGPWRSIAEHLGALREMADAAHSFTLVPTSAATRRPDIRMPVRT